MTDWDAAAYVGRLLSDAGPSTRCAVHTGSTWTSVRPEGANLPEAGWKLHVSSRGANYPDLLRTLVPVLLAERCTFKVARSTATLEEMNAGVTAPAAVGKAVTVYPRLTEVRRLGLRLAALLRGHDGPRVMSDRRVDPAAPVYYRYGPFSARWYVAPGGRLTVGVADPDGTMHDGLAGLAYRRPDWVSDPFGAADQVAATVLGDHYRVVSGLRQAARGNVYRAVDDRSGRPVVVKQARAHVEEARNGVDARVRLRNERHVLTRCADVAGVPAVLDHFAHGADEYLVLEDMGELSLLEAVLGERILLPPGSPPPRTGDPLPVLATGLATVLTALHRREVVMSDVTAANVVLGGDGRPALVDFGLAATPGIRLSGGTPGFACPEQLAGNPPRVAFDGFSLGMLLAFAATGMLPLTGVPTGALAARRTLSGLHAVYGDSQDELVALVAELTSLDDDRVTAALTTLAGAGEIASGPAADGIGMALPVPSAARPAPTPGRTGGTAGGTAGTTGDPADRAVLVEDLAASLADRIRAEADALLDATDPETAAAFDGSVYTGTAGVGLALLPYLDRPGVARTITRIAGHAAGVGCSVPLPASLFVGSTGITLFLRRAAALGVTVPADLGAGREVTAGPGPGLAPEALDGVTGAGLGGLLVAEDGGPPAYTALADRCALRLREQLRADPRMASAPPSPPGAGVDATAGYAHGLAGPVDFLLRHAARTGDEESRRTAATAVEYLLERTAELVALAPRPTTIAVSVSWCQGLSGLVRTLLTAADVLADDRCRAAALDAALAGAARVPRMHVLGQCCGLAGLGNALVELAGRTGDERCVTGADAVLDQLLRRSAGPDEAPEFVDHAHDPAPLSWAAGAAGVLAFLTRLRDPARPDLLLA